ncbi:Maph22 [Matsumuraeses phaseoli granulovirus]|uniref:Maph22 n=1 Tax=Matsumuraeses phaseoli granulovirus TaxID=2760664 RepID=A0AAE7SY38_9BBAC|nr:Maph22 [Matsumuraeses phaseoli granulovirus]QOD39985.1 Maph22 [Matsumuraeses phaseoli granulovirus]
MMFERAELMLGRDVSIELTLVARVVRAVLSVSTVSLRVVNWAVTSVSKVFTVVCKVETSAFTAWTASKTGVRSVAVPPLAKICWTSAKIACSKVWLFCSVCKICTRYSQRLFEPEPGGQGLEELCPGGIIQRGFVALHVLESAT